MPKKPLAPWKERIREVDETIERIEKSQRGDWQGALAKDIKAEILEEIRPQLEELKRMMVELEEMREIDRRVREDEAREKKASK